MHNRPPAIQSYRQKLTLFDYNMIRIAETLELLGLQTKLENAAQNIVQIDFPKGRIEQGVRKWIGLMLL